MTDRSEADRLRQERDHARARWDEYHRLAEATSSDLNDAEAEVARLRNTMQRALNSLNTGPLQHGYAASIIRSALGKDPT